MNIDASAIKQQKTSRAKKAFDSACQRIAPTWPLDQFIAVNPFWELRDLSYKEVTGRLAMLDGIQHFLPTTYFQRLYKQGAICPSMLQASAKSHQVKLKGEELEAYLAEDINPVNNLMTLSNFYDQHRANDKMSWREEITHQISQFCAIHFQQQGSDVEQTKTTQKNNLYAHWLEVTKRDSGLSILMREPQLNEMFKQLPEDCESLYALAVKELSLPQDSIEYYAHSLLLEINGWASWTAYLRFQSKLNQQSHHTMQALLATKLAWELVLYWYHKKFKPKRFSLIQSQWKQQLSTLDDMALAHKKAQIPLHIWQSALELSYQKKLHQKLRTQRAFVANSPPRLQAIFCIDVRSEIIRRSLEQQSDQIETLGFAGFFGLPIELQAPQTSFTRPQLPGLLKPGLVAKSSESKRNLTFSPQGKARWQNWTKSAPASFSMVESAGWWYAFKLLKQSLNSKHQENPINQLSHGEDWHLFQDNIELSDRDKAGLVQNVLSAMGIQTFAPTVLLVGHGSQSTNNLHASSLDCGACGGQTGEVNVRILAALLNNNQIREILNEKGTHIPASTEFIAALHNTTTDVITCFDKQPGDLINKWLSKATQNTQQTRLQLIQPNSQNRSSNYILNALKRRANDWSQVRPEWGLANNAALLIGPRSWTRSLDLMGRCFLHNYDHHTDSDNSILELLLTAPMVVAHWINMQYNASVTDNHKYGSGNKVLHNAVNGNMGVFEGNGGDLRIGLPFQSIHDGQKWMHTPQRLSVYVAAPRESIEKIIQKHKDIQHLVDNNWLYLFRWDQSEIEQIQHNQWTAISY